MSFASAVSFASTVPVLGASSVGGEALEISAYDRPVGTLALISSGFGGAFYGAKKHIHSKYPRSLFLQFTFNKLIAFLPPAFNRAAETRLVRMVAVFCALASAHASSMSSLISELLFLLGCLDLNAASNIFEGFFKHQLVYQIGGYKRLQNFGLHQRMLLKYFDPEFPGNRPYLRHCTGLEL